MDIVIHGTKGGRKIFTPKKISGLLDVTADISKASAIGQMAYAIRITAENTIFSKYKIIRDVRGDKRTGFVAFSLFIPINEKLSGTNILELLDRVCSEYCEKYIVGDNLDAEIENWDFVDRISSEYVAKLRTISSSNTSDTLQSGSRDDAFAYFEDLHELQRYFDAPSQEEYSDYRQILFISKALEGKPEDPLNALRNSGVRLNNIDLENKYYYLNNYNPGKGVVITANGKACSERKKNNYIRAKWQIEIRYLKDEQCFLPIEAKGTLSNLESEIYNYLEIKDSNIIIRYDAFNNPTPRTKTISFEITDRIGNSITDAEIKIGNQPWQKVIGHQYEYTFKGEELKTSWTVWTRKESENLLAENLYIVPEKQNETAILILQKEIVIEIFAINEENGNRFSNFKLWISDGKGYRENNTKLIFKDDDIKKTWNIEITAKEGKDIFSATEKYNPTEGENPLYVKLQRETTQSAKHKTNELGESEKKENSSDIPRIRYKKVKALFSQPSFLAGLIVSILIFCVLIVYLLTKPEQGVQDQINPADIASYVEGTELKLERLNNFRIKWESRMPEIAEKGGGIFGIFGGGEKQTDSTEYKKWNKVLQSIDSAITKRKLTNNKDFMELKNKSYSLNQRVFKKAIDKIDTANYKKITDNLGDISALPLNKIADSINAILVSKKASKKQPAPQNGEQLDAEPENKLTISELDKNNLKESNLQDDEKPSTPSSEITKRPSVKEEKTSNNITTEIIQYLRGSELDKQKLEEYKKTKGISQPLKNSIQLCLDFWESNEFDKPYSSLYPKVKKDATLKISKLNTFLERIHSSNIPSYSRRDKKQGLE